MKIKNYLLFEHIKIVDNDTNEQIQCEEGTNDNEYDKEQVSNECVFSSWLLIYLQYIRCKLDSGYPD